MTVLLDYGFCTAVIAVILFVNLVTKNYKEVNYAIRKYV